MNKKILTLCFIYEHPKILLGMKKRGHGEGKWNGFGGKVEQGETIEEGAKREMKEEAGIEIKEMNKLGILEFESQNDPEILEVHIFSVKEFKGVPIESEEMKPKWFDVDEIPFNQMWENDALWIEKVLKTNHKMEGTIWHDENDKIVKHKLNTVEALSS